MKLTLIPFLAAVASAITLPVSKMDQDPQMTEARLGVRVPLVG